MLHLEGYPFLQPMEADGTVAIEIHANLVLGWPAALLNYKGIRAGDTLTQMDVTE